MQNKISIGEVIIRTRVLVVIMIILGCAYVIICFLEFYKFIQYENYGITTIGYIYEIKKEELDTNGLIEIKYFTNAREEIFIERSYNTHEVNYYVGDTLKVVYLKDSFKDAKIYPNSDYLSIYFFAIAVALLIISALIIVNFNRVILFMYKWFDFNDII
jgi:cytochrome c oxidase assembly protein Cox11